MAKLTLPTINSGFLSTEQLNDSFRQIEAAIENTVSRDGDAPNNMTADLDLNGRAILNVGFSNNDNSVASLAQVKSLASGVVLARRQSFTATSGQTAFTLTEFSYQAGSFNLGVYVNGVRKFPGTDFTENSSTQFTMLVPLTVGDNVVCISNEYFGSIDVNAPAAVAWGTITNIPAFASRWPTYAEVTDKPATFAPSAHEHSAVDITSGRLADARRGVFVQSTAPASPAIGDRWAW